MTDQQIRETEQQIRTRNLFESELIKRINELETDIMITRQYIAGTSNKLAKQGLEKLYDVMVATVDILTAELITGRMHL